MTAKRKPQNVVIWRNSKAEVNPSWKDAVGECCIGICCGLLIVQSDSVVHLVHLRLGLAFLRRPSALHQHSNQSEPLPEHRLQPNAHTGSAGTRFPGWDSGTVELLDTVAERAMSSGHPTFPVLAVHSGVRGSANKSVPQPLRESEIWLRVAHENVWLSLAGYVRLRSLPPGQRHVHHFWDGFESIRLVNTCIFELSVCSSNSDQMPI